MAINTVNELKAQYALGLLDDDYIVEMLKPIAPYWDSIIPSVPEEILAFLSGHRHSMIRYYVAGNHNTPIEVLRKLSKDENIFVRMTADCNMKRIERCETVE